MGAQQMKSGQTRAILQRKARAGEDAAKLLREKRMGDLAWQMSVLSIKLKRFGANNPAADALKRLFAEAEFEYDRLQIEAESEDMTVKYGPLIG